MDPSGKILAMGSQVSSSGTSIKTLFFSQYDSSAMELWRSSYNLLTAGSMLNFIPNMMIFDSSIYTKTIVWESGPIANANSHFAVFDVINNKVT
jgi:hypothetical protein